MVFTVISLLIAIYAFFNYKKALMLFTVFQIFWYPTHIFNIGNISISTNVFVPLVFFILYFFHNKSEKKEKFPFLFPFIIIVLSSFLSCFTALGGFQIEFSRFLTRLVSIYLYIYILWNTVVDKKDFLFIFKCITYVILFSCIYGLVEYITKSNILLDYKVLSSLNSISLYDMNGSRGYRLTSVFEHPIGAAMTFGLYSIFYFSLFIKDNDFSKKIKFGFLTMILCIPCIVLSKMRTGILFTIAFGLLIFLSSKISKKKMQKLIVLFLIFSPLFLILVSSNASLFSNMFSANASKIGGSSLDMRIEQFNAIKNVISDSKLFGYGETFRNYIIRTHYTDAALGYEGLVFEKMSMNGYFGLIVFLIFVIYSVIFLPKKYKSSEIFCLFFSYWLAYFVSSIPSFRIVILYIFIFYYMRRNSFEKNNGNGEC